MDKIMITEKLWFVNTFDQYKAFMYVLSVSCRC